MASQKQWTTLPTPEYLIRNQYIISMLQYQCLNFKKKKPKSINMIITWNLIIFVINEHYVLFVLYL